MKIKGIISMGLTLALSLTFMGCGKDTGELIQSSFGNISNYKNFQMDVTLSANLSSNNSFLKIPDIKLTGKSNSIFDKENKMTATNFSGSIEGMGDKEVTLITEEKDDVINSYFKFDEEWVKNSQSIKDFIKGNPDSEVSKEDKLKNDIETFIESKVSYFEKGDNVENNIFEYVASFTYKDIQELLNITKRLDITAIDDDTQEGIFEISDLINKDTDTAIPIVLRIDKDKEQLLGIKIDFTEITKSAISSIAKNNIKKSQKKSADDIDNEVVVIEEKKQETINNVLENVEVSKVVLTFEFSNFDNCDKITIPDV